MNSSGGTKYACLNESPSEKEGKCALENSGQGTLESLNESPSEKEGKFTSPRWI